VEGNGGAGGKKDLDGTIPTPKISRYLSAKIRLQGEGGREGAESGNASLDGPGALSRAI